MKRAWSDGTRALVFTPAELVEKLAALVPPPRSHQVLYHGIFAANAAWRKEIVPKPKAETPEEVARREGRKLVQVTVKVDSPNAQPTWADLLSRVFGEDGWRCPDCGGPLRLRCVVFNPPAATRIIEGLRRATGPPAA